MSFSDRTSDSGEGRGVDDSAENILHWTSSFLEPPTDSWGKGRRSLVRLLSDVSANNIAY